MHLDGATRGDDVDLVDDVTVALAMARDGEVAIDIGAEAVHVLSEGTLQRSHSTVLDRQIKL